MTMTAVPLVRQGGHVSIGRSLARQSVEPVVGPRGGHYRLVVVTYQSLAPSRGSAW